MPRFGDIELEALIGRGGMAEVYRGRYVAGSRMGWPVAIKRLSAERSAEPLSVQLFLSEGELSKQLKHPHIVEVYDTGALSGVTFITMELVEGSDLALIIRRANELQLDLPIDFCCFLAAAVADGLHHAHVAADRHGTPLGIVHCDVTPSNVFVSRTGEIKLGDFGVARAATGPKVEGGSFGKLGYISPEQLRGEAVSPSSDIYALGLLTYELLTGEPAYATDDPQEMLKRMRKRPTPPSSIRPDIPPALDAAILATLDPKSQRRTATAAAFADHLRQNFDDRVGTPLAIAALVRGLVETSVERAQASGARPKTMNANAVVRPATRGTAARPKPPPPPPQTGHFALVTPRPTEPLFGLLGRLHRERADALVQVEAGGPPRQLFIRQGRLGSATAVLQAALRESREGVVLPLPPTAPAGDRWIGALVVEAFRAGFQPPQPTKWPRRPRLAPAELSELGLQPVELARVQRLVEEPAGPGGSDSAEIRAVLTALVELGFIQG